MFEGRCRTLDALFATLRDLFLCTFGLFVPSCHADPGDYSIIEGFLNRDRYRRIWESQNPIPA
jgi:hypothetical protein